MSPAVIPFQTAPPVVPAIPALPAIQKWQTHLPDHFNDLEHGNKFLMSGTDRFLEMNPNGTRGYEKKTEYAILSIVILSIEMAVPLFGKGDPQSGGSTTEAKHIIRSNKTKQFLCMNNQSIVYQSSTFNVAECIFTNRVEKNLFETYYRYAPNNRTKWYLGLNKDGSVRCGNVTRRNHSSAMFQVVFVTDKSELSKAPPFPGNNKNCCQKKCRKKDRRRRKEENNNALGTISRHRHRGSRDRKCRKFKKWCKNKRRRFFNLKLKDLKRYFRRCIQNKGCQVER